MQSVSRIVIPALLIGFISIGLSYLLLTKVRYFEDFIYSSRFPINQFKEKRIILVLINDDTIRKMGPYPFKRSEYAKVLTKILKGKPKVIGIDIFFTVIKDLQDDMKLIEVLDKADTHIVLAVYPMEVDNLIINKIESLSPHRYYYNYKNISIGNVELFADSKAAGITKISAIPVIDGRYEREYLPFAIVVASKYLGSDYKQKTLLAKRTLVATIGDIEIPLKPSYMLINYIGGNESFNIISFEKVSGTDPSIFQNKIVLIGASAESIGDSFVTPISKKTPGVVIHANAIHTIINNQFILEVPLSYQMGIIVLICCAIPILVYFLRPLTSLSTSIFILIAYKIIIDFIFTKHRLYFSFTLFFFSVLFSYFGTFVWIKLKNKRVEK